MASNQQETVQNVLQIISDLRGESSTNTDAIRLRAVSRANLDFARRMYWRFYRLDNQTKVGSGVNSYQIDTTTNPMRMKGLTEVFVAKTSDTDKTQEGMRYKIVDYNTYKELYNGDNSQRLTYEWFDAANDVWKMYLNPAPVATDTITYSYYWEPPVKTLTTDKVLCPNMRIIALLALAEIYESEDEGDLAVEKKNEVEQLISECVSKENSPAVNQFYAMGVAENSGIGNY
jgi:hypothetical protein